MHSVNKSSSKSPKHFYNIGVDEVKVEVMSERGNFYGFLFENNSASVVFVQVFNKLAAAVTVGTTTPDFTYKIIPNAVQGKDPSDLALDSFNPGMTIAVTSGREDANAPAAPSSFKL